MTTATTEPKTTPAPTTPEPAAEEGTLLGTKPAAPTETPEQKAQREAQEADDKRILEADDAALKPEELAKKKEMLKAKADGIVPEKYEVKVEGFDVDEKMLEGLTPVFKKHNLTQGAVQELAAAYAPLMKAQVEAIREKALSDFQSEIKGWKDQTIKDLGADWQKEMSFAAKFIDKFGGDDVRAILEDTGAGNHPAIVKLFVAAGKAISSDSFVDSNKNAKSGPGELVYDHPSSSDLK